MPPHCAKQKVLNWNRGVPNQNRIYNENLRLDCAKMIFVKPLELDIITFKDNLPLYCPNLHLYTYTIFTVKVSSKSPQFFMSRFPLAYTSAKNELIFITNELKRFQTLWNLVYYKPFELKFNIKMNLPKDRFLNSTWMLLHCSSGL